MTNTINGLNVLMIFFFKMQVELMWTPTFILKNENSYIKSYGLGWFIEYFSVSYFLL